MSRSDWPVQLDEVFGCWIWQGHKDRRDGRALMWRAGGPINAYRHVYQIEVGPVPDGLVLGHECNNASCVAPHHLRPTTKSENEQHKNWRRVMRITTCKNGHDQKIHAVVTPGAGGRPGRVCRQCNRDAEAREGTP